MQAENQDKQNTSNAVVQLHNATIRQRDRVVLEGVHLTVNRGEYVYLVGKTGTGKSSLLKTLYGDLPLEKGKGEVVGFKLSDINWKNVPMLRRKLGIIFQDFQLLMDRNVNDNLQFALEATEWKNKKHIDERIGEVLAQVKMESKRYEMPYKMSGGEQQRIAIARALLNHPVLILADEPTGNLDPETSEEIFGLIHSLSAKTNTAAIIGTHDFYTIEKFDGRMILCKDSKLIHQQDIHLNTT